ncbi:MAG: selenide, water dikinase SelD [Chitinophagales bacterium]
MFELKGSGTAPTQRLTHFSKAAGCGCKIAPAVLKEITEGVKDFPFDAKLLVGPQTSDDAAVIQWDEHQALISTVDFFAPIVDDPFLFGKIASANALSDVYAMGGKPVIALAVLGWPIEKLPVQMAQQVMQGAIEQCNEAGVMLGGGHTIDAAEPFFGLSVNGIVSPRHLKRNSGGRDGDLLFLTKQLGTGVLATARKRDLITDADWQDACQSMSTLNSEGTQMGTLDSVHALTDVTGFGLLGHLLEMCDGANLGAELHLKKLPLFAKVQELTAAYIYADNTMRNWKAFSSRCTGIENHDILIVCDPQTNGGLLVAVANEAADSFQKTFPAAVCIGRLTGAFTGAKGI